jgi:MFS family permease
MPSVDPSISTSSAIPTSRPETHRAQFSNLIIVIAVATVFVHWFTGSQYGFHRDELATLDDSRHLAWGYVAYPPLTPFFGRLSLLLFGTSLSGFRFFAALASAVSLLLTGLMAREFGGGRRAQVMAVMAALPVCFATGALMQYVAFDYLFWVLSAYFVLRLLNSEAPRWWPLVGASVGLGMLAKYGIVFWVAGIIIGFLLTDSRRYLKNKWFLIGCGIAIVIFLPNVIWQVHNHFISLDFLKHIHERDVRIGRTKDFVPDQFKMTLFAVPIWMLGLYFCLISTIGRRYRSIGWMYVVPLTIFVIAKGRGYYLLAAYPMLYAAGAVLGERWLASVRPARANLVAGITLAALVFNTAFIAAITLPIAPIQSRWWKIANSMNDDLGEEVGWPELVETVAKVRDTLPVNERGHLGILAANYGEAGAIDLYGPQYGLPNAISGVNSFWQRGYGDPPPQTLIILGESAEFVNPRFESCRFAAQVWNRYGVQNEETRDHPEIYVCRDLKSSWPEFWKTFRHFG